MKTRTNIKAILTALIVIVFSANTGFCESIEDFYKRHKNDSGMEARLVPPKLASMMLEEDYDEAKNVLMSLRSLKYMNYWGKTDKISSYTKAANDAASEHQMLMEDVVDNKKIRVFGTKKNGTIRKILVVVESNAQFLLMIGKGKLSTAQLKMIPELSKEIQ